MLPNIKNGNNKPLVLCSKIKRNDFFFFFYPDTKKNVVNRIGKQKRKIEELQ